MNDQELKIGDTVQIKGGNLRNPRMSVHKIVGDLVTCQWFDESKPPNSKSDTFDKNQLKLIRHN